jgi:hypothetical protein
MKVDVFHADFDGTGPTGTFTKVAVVTADTVSDSPVTTESEALDYAYRWTNNIEGSWSKKVAWLYDSSNKMFNNGDFNVDVEVVAPLLDVDGKALGHRSSMMGDKFVVNGKEFAVATFGFNEVS